MITFHRREGGLSDRDIGGQPAPSRASGAIYHKTWDIEGSPDRPPVTGVIMSRTPTGGVVPGRDMITPVTGGSAVLKQPSL
jgi:hypothetical protein